MKRLRVAFALLFQLLLLQAGVLGGGMVCAPAWLPSGPADAGMARGGHEGHARPLGAHATADQASAHPAADGGDETAPGHGGAMAHCAAAAGCAAVASPADAPTRASVAIVHEAVAVGRVSSPRSMRRAPEPPPPRA